MPDAKFAHPRLAAIYDALEPPRDDLEPYLALAEELGARSVLDVGCGTGTFALLLAARGVRVVGVDPAGASLDVARRKPGSEGVTWLDGDATGLPPLAVDLATMTANVAQAIVDPADWAGTLRGVRAALRPGGHLAFETRDPAARAWEGWASEPPVERHDVDGVGVVEHRFAVTEVALPLVTFAETYTFPDGEELTSVSTLRFRERDEVEADLAGAGLELVDVRGAPDRHGQELVFVARRPLPA